MPVTSFQLHVNGLKTGCRLANTVPGCMLPGKKVFEVRSEARGVRKEMQYSRPKPKRHLSIFNPDEFVKSRHSRAGGNPESTNRLKRLDSRFHGNDGKLDLRTFYGTINPCDSSFFLKIPRLIRNSCFCPESQVP